MSWGDYSLRAETHHLSHHGSHSDQGSSRISSAGRGASLAKFINDRRTSVISVAANLWRDVHHKTSMHSGTPAPSHHGPEDPLENYPLPPPSITRQLAFGFPLDDQESGAPLGKTVMTATFLAKLLAVVFVLVCVLAVVLLRLKEFDLDQKLYDKWSNARKTNSSSEFYDLLNV